MLACAAINSVKDYVNKSTKAFDEWTEYNWKNTDILTE